MVLLSFLRQETQALRFIGREGMSKPRGLRGPASFLAGPAAAPDRGRTRGLAEGISGRGCPGEANGRVVSLPLVRATGGRPADPAPLSAAVPGVALPRVCLG